MPSAEEDGIGMPSYTRTHRYADLDNALGQTEGRTAHAPSRL